MTRERGYVLHAGVGFDGRPIVVIAVLHSDNRKTGDMVQVYILPTEESPEKAVIGGRDESVCGDCPFRSGSGCYVNVGHGPRAVWQTWQNGTYPQWDGSLTPFRGRMVRWGAYGEPVLIPLPILRRINRVAAGWTGYTHAWRSCDQRYRRWFMASVESESARVQAMESGWRTFRVRSADDPLLSGEAICPGSAERQSTAYRLFTCSECGACDGSRRDGDRRVSFTVIAHGLRHSLAAAVTKRVALALVSENTPHRIVSTS